MSALTVTPVPAPNGDDPRGRTARGPDAVVGAGRLFRAQIKSELRRWAPFIAIATGLPASSLLLYATIFPTQEDRAGLAVAVGSNPAIEIIFGPATDLSTADGFAVWRSLALAGFLAAMAAIFCVTRRGRALEDSGQAELVDANVVGRSARLSAAVLLSLFFSVLLGAVSGVVTALCGGAWETSLLLGATFTATGWLFTGVSALAGQIASDGHAANSVSMAVLGALFLLRGCLGAMSAPDWVQGINPLAWIERTQPGSENLWWPLLPVAVLAAVLCALAFAVQGRRDFGFGLIAPKPGPAVGRVRGAWALTARLNRTTSFTWLGAFAVLGVVFGYLSTSVQDLLSANETVQGILASGAVTPLDMTRGFVKTILGILGAIASVAGIQVVLRVRAEEVAERLEVLLATPLSRLRYFGAAIAFALLLSSALTLLAGAVIAAIASVGGSGLGFGAVFLQALLTLPAVWAVVGFSVLLIGVRPAVAPLAWAGVVLSLLLTLFGPTFKLSDAVLGIDPFWHVPLVVSGVPALGGLALVALVAAVLVGAGCVGFTRRDVGK